MTRVYLNPKTRGYLIRRWLANLIWPRDEPRLQMIINGKSTGWWAIKDAWDITIDVDKQSYEIIEHKFGRRGLVDNPRDVGP